MNYVFNGGRNIFESLTKEEILAAIVEAVETHEITDVDTGFITTIKEMNSGRGLKFWLGTTAQYNALPVKDDETFYILTDDSELNDIDAAIQSLNDRLDATIGLKGQILFDGILEYGSGYSIALTGTHRLDEYSVVKVAFAAGGANEIICNVKVNESTVQITGVGNYPISSENGTQFAAANITVNRSENTITRSASVVTTLIKGSTNVNIDRARIFKIIGVC